MLPEAVIQVIACIKNNHLWLVFVLKCHDRFKITSDANKKTEN